MQVYYYDPLNPGVNSAVFDVLRVVSWDVDPVFSEDGIDLLYAKYRFTFQALINDDAMHASRAIANTRIPPAPLSGYPRSLEYLQRVLSTPRLRLDVLENNYLIFRSHGNYLLPNGVSYAATCDVGGGPKPINFRAFQISGLKSHLITWSVESWRRRSYQTAPDGGRTIQADNANVPGGVPSPAPTNPSFVLSHRFSQSDSISPEMFTKRTTSGKIVLDAGLTRAYALSADNFRAAGVFHTLPPGFARTSVEVQSASDGNSLTYTVVDTEQPANLGANSQLARVDADVKVETSEGDVKLFEQVICTASVRVWGRPGVTRATLSQNVMNVLIGFGFNPAVNVGVFNVKLFNPCFRISSGYDLYGRMAWATANFISGRNLFNDLITVAANGAASNNIRTGILQTSEYTNHLITPQATSGATPKLAGAYETQIAQMIAQALNNEGIAARLPQDYQPFIRQGAFPARPDNL